MSFQPDNLQRAWPRGVPVDPQRAALHCSAGSWQRMQRRLVMMQGPVGAGPEVLVHWLLEAPGRVRADAQRLLRTMERRPWQVLPLVGRYHGPARLGFCVVSGARKWWLQFEPAPSLRIVRIEVIRGEQP